MITRSTIAPDSFDLVCDSCGHSPVQVFDKFNDAVRYKKITGWRGIKIGDEWEDRCPECCKKALT